jgi:hypothetical protein
MLKSVAAGMMCLGLATLGVAISRGQDDPKPDSEEIKVVTTPVEAVVVEGDVKVVEGRSVAEGQPLDIVEIQVGSDELDVAAFPDRKTLRVQVEGKDVVVATDDGKIVERHALGAEPLTGRIVRSIRPPTVAPETRETLEKLLGRLRDDAKRLEKEGKQSEAAQTIQSIQALEQILAGQPFGIASDRVVHIREAANPEELKKLHARRDELAAQLTKATVNDEVAAKLKQELAATENAITQLQKQGEARAIYRFGAGMAPGMPGMGGMAGMGPPSSMGGMGGMRAGAMGPGRGGFAHFTGMHAKSAALAQQAEALSQAAAKLKEAGLGEQAKQLADQAEKLKDQAAAVAKQEAEQFHAQAPGGAGGWGRFPGAGGVAVFGGGGPPAELQRSIKELHEQVQLLRNEVAELRELLQQKR